MNWQYRTILFEFQKDGLLGDRYIDDDEMEDVLNEQGREGWELVTVTPVKEGLLSFFKRGVSQAGKSAGLAEKVIQGKSQPGGVDPQKPSPRPKSTPVAEQTTVDKPVHKPDMVGGIKIS